MYREQQIQSIVEKISCFLRDTAKLSFSCGENTLTFAQADMLFLLASFTDGLNVKELAQKLNVTSGAITQSTDSLVEKELVVREIDTKDHRFLHLKLTPKARKLFDTFKNNYSRMIDPAFSILTDEELAQLDILISKVYNRKIT